MDEKYLLLKKKIKELGKVVVAFSGGVDSTFLLKVCHDVLKENVLAVTINSPYIPKWEIEEATEIVKKIGINHKIINLNEIPQIIKFNPKDRCYLCKNKVFNIILDEANAFGTKYVLDGSNKDDLKDYRPGMRALKELNIKSLLLECDITKNEIRKYSKELNLPTWKKPAYACLLSRIPYNTEIKEDELRKIEHAEKYLIDLGLYIVRVRCHDDLARIETSKEDMNKIFNEDLMEQIVINLKRFGFNTVTLDLQGYRMGSLNEQILK